jgi:hypothetical protein
VNLGRAKALTIRGTVRIRDIDSMNLYRQALIRKSAELETLKKRVS